ANMAPEYGATCGIFPIDAETLRFLRFTNRPEWLVRLVEAYAKAQGLFHAPDAPEPVYSDALALDLATVEPSLAGPSRPQDRVRLADVKKVFADALPNLLVTGARPKAVSLPGVVPAGVTGPAGQVSPDEAVPMVAVAKEVSEGGPDV